MAKPVLKSGKGTRSKALRGADTALLIIDVINDLDFPGGEHVLPWASRMVERLAPFAARMRKAGVPVIYVNDNFNHWRSNFRDVYRHCTRAGSRGRGIVRALRPHATDYFVLKPKHSAFFATSLVPLLEHLGTKKLLMAGIATNLCVFFSAHDAHMLEYDITVLSDCCCAESDTDHDLALDQLQRFLGVRVCRADEVKRKGRFRRPAHPSKGSGRL
ncbi:cysteine hydrolase family protein [Myxococcus llanfairpwllgwyngyllgogerychwyrndrobwllllantysiliogogogochensis]|uniref:cysteine hydrolase family protein n=1 Tax=Myxococcus llanfairpwllgwyngyllgogerychwyrndrobwllllantysiliogogogochensis TaxID=2590453 RepID=UPI001FE655AD|nr:isochorismatase family cysteine hydrolase [Myxococcus llanfairpwllgwyngyllgogerychwyrndrobwllllantysiliogogogochensis]